MDDSRVEVRDSRFETQDSSLKTQASRLKPQASRLKPQASRLKPHASSLKPRDSSGTPIHPLLSGVLPSDQPIPTSLVSTIRIVTNSHQPLNESLVL
ncbi:hypothetical protein BGAL_0061g00160 [Botrytis galanthina]|uniref:Uncharacterized protein n=1 Tax=Botrytis galanthina TaxID=278940 RepID=A0A4S8R626_9HELO|nr:hypothetical protein BGAL_0061g00160 [Botrytis galanthina]